MTDDAKMLVVEAVVPDDTGDHFANLLDLEMLVAGTGRERTTARYRELLARAGLRLHRIVPTVGLPSVIEAQVA